jgi:hypothetical protein
MDKFIILTVPEMTEWGIVNIVDNLYTIGNDGTGMFGFTTVPAALSSNTVYDKSEIESMFRDNTNAFYKKGY